MDAASTQMCLEAAHDGLADLPDFDAESIETLLRGMVKEIDVKAGQLFGSLRVATTGQRIAPPLFESLEVLGRGAQPRTDSKTRATTWMSQQPAQK